jgi:sirohydrochlorin cobaltochelatase
MPVALPHSTSNTDVPAGLLLVGHGTRDRRGIGEFLTLTRLVAKQAVKVAVESAFLELAEPTIAQGLARLVERGARQVVVVPLLLFSAGHDQHDIPAAVKEAVGQGSSLPLNSVLAGETPTLRTAQAEHLGCDRLVLELSRRRFTEALHSRAEVPAERTCLLLVGRGSREVSATAEMHDFARLRTEQTPVGATQVAFLAMAQPSVRDILPRLAAQNWRRIVVQPHLLFQGLLLEELAAEVRTIGARNPHQEWVVASHLAAGIGTERLGVTVVEHRSTAANPGLALLDPSHPETSPTDALLVDLVLQRYHQGAIRIVGAAAAG